MSIRSSLPPLLAATLAAAGLAGLLAAGSAQAAPVPVSRVTVTTITPGAGDFSGSTASYDNQFGFDAGAGDYMVNLALRSGWQNLVVQGMGGTSVNFDLGFPAAGASSTPLTISSPGGTGQGWEFRYDMPIAASFGSSFITYGELGGNHVLNFSGGGTDFVDAGASFLSVVRILGDWSDPALRTAASYNPAYTVVDDFVYDSVTGYTTFSVFDADYSLSTNPGIAFALVGDAVAAEVPEPAGLSLLGAAAFAAVASLRGRRRRSGS